MSSLHIKRLDGTNIPVFVFNVKNAPENTPAIIVLQEWWGINDQIKKFAQYFADHGYQAIIPDLYRGKIGVDAEEASHLMSNLDFKDAVKDIEACICHLRENSPQRKIAITGFCMGGALSLASAVLLPTQLQASLPFYGIPSPSLCDLKTIKTPVQAHFGDLDTIPGFSDKEAANQLEVQLKEAGVPYEFYRYPNQGHAFMNDTEWSFQKRKEMGLPPYDPQVVKTAWERVFSFLQKHLKSESSL